MNIKELLEERAMLSHQEKDIKAAQAANNKKIKQYQEQCKHKEVWEEVHPYTYATCSICNKNLGMRD